MLGNNLNDDQRQKGLVLYTLLNGMFYEYSQNPVENSDDEKEISVEFLLPFYEEPVILKGLLSKEQLILWKKYIDKIDPQYIRHFGSSI